MNVLQQCFGFYYDVHSGAKGMTNYPFQLEFDFAKKLDLDWFMDGYKRMLAFNRMGDILFN